MKSRVLARIARFKRFTRTACFGHDTGSMTVSLFLNIRLSASVDVRRPSLHFQRLRVPAEDTRRTRAVTRVRSIRVHGSSTRVVYTARLVSRAKRTEITETREPKSDDTAVGEERVGVSSTSSEHRWKESWSPIENDLARDD